MGMTEIATHTPEPDECGECGEKQGATELLKEIWEWNAGLGYWDGSMWEKVRIFLYPQGELDNKEGKDE